MPIDPAKPFDLHFKVDPNWIDMRLDLFVKAMVPSMSRSKIQKYIKQGRIEVNATPRRANWLVRLGDQVLLRCNVPEEGEDAGKYIPLEILYEDDDIIAVNKQPGLVVHPVAMHRHDTLLNALYWQYKDILPEEQEISLANRLDQFTSGVILVTKHVRAKRAIQDDFEARGPKKRYMALCEGVVENDRGEIDAPLAREETSGDKCRMCVSPAGKPSLTRYAVTERFRDYSLMQLEPHTGRQHQLRVHMQSIGHPLVCDDRYGSREALVVSLPHHKEAVVNRYALHAREITFDHPISGKKMTILAPLPDDMESVLQGLRQGGEEKRRMILKSDS